MADFMARLVVRNALFFGRGKFSSLIIPWYSTAHRTVCESKEWLDDAHGCDAEGLLPVCRTNRATYCEPEVAHVGLYERDLIARGIQVKSSCSIPLLPNYCLTVVCGSTTQYKTFKRELSHVDRAILDGQTAGFVKIHCKKGGDQILGATVVGEHAGDLISEITLAMQSKTGISCVCVCV